MVQGQVFLKRGGEGGAGTFFISFFKDLSFLHLEIALRFFAKLSLQSYVMHLKKDLCFSVPTI